MTESITHELTELGGYAGHGVGLFEVLRCPICRPAAAELIASTLIEFHSRPVVPEPHGVAPESEGTAVPDWAGDE